MKTGTYRPDGNKMIIRTGHATFDRQTNVIGDGNIIANTELGQHIRSFKTTTNGPMVVRPEGHMQDFDLDTFGKLRMPQHVRKFIKEQAVDEGVWVYCFFHWTPSRRSRYGHTAAHAIVHGWVVVSAYAEDYSKRNEEGSVVLRKFYTGPTWKSDNIVDVCAEYVANIPAVDEKPQAQRQ